jgi:hypothetical protein
VYRNADITVPRTVGFWLDRHSCNDHVNIRISVLDSCLGLLT